MILEKKTGLFSPKSNERLTSGWVGWWLMTETSLDENLILSTSNIVASLASIHKVLFDIIIFLGHTYFFITLQGLRVEEATENLAKSISNRDAPVSYIPSLKGVFMQDQPKSTYLYSQQWKRQFLIDDHFHCFCEHLSLFKSACKLCNTIWAIGTIS